MQKLVHQQLGLERLNIPVRIRLARVEPSM